MPKHICGSDKYLIPITDKFIAQIDHWSNLWSVNIVSVLSNIARLQKIPKVKLFALALKALSVNKWKILEQFNTIGTGCDIHPTAYVEGSTIGDNVTVGAHSIIRESIIGNNAFIGNGVKIETSVIGEKSSILHGHIMFSVFYPGVFSVAQMISASLVGRDSFIVSGVSLTDFRHDGRSVTVVKDGISIDTGNTFIGACLGHETYLGSGCVVAPGRVIPDGVRIAPEKKRVITGIDSHESEGYRLIKKTE
jgi:NDP-sugar pyrophosphorylase family protein